MEWISVYDMQPSEMEPVLLRVVTEQQVLYLQGRLVYSGSDVPLGYWDTIYPILPYNWMPLSSNNITHWAYIEEPEDWEE